MPLPNTTDRDFHLAITGDESFFRPFRLTASPASNDLQQRGFTGILTVKKPGLELHFAYRCTSTWTRREFQQFIRDAEALHKHTTIRPLLVTTYLSSRHLDDLDAAGVSGLDLAGNGLLQAPPVYVRNSGAKNRHKLTSPPTYVYRSWKLATLVPRVFAATTYFPTVQAVLDACHARMMHRGDAPLPLTISTVSKALSQLEEDLAIARKGREAHLLHVERLLDGLVRAYKPPVTSARCRGRTSLTPDKAWDILRKLRPELRAVVTGRGSASLRSNLADTEQLHLYVSNMSLVSSALQVRPTEAFPNIELLETAEEGVYFDALDDARATWSSPLQTYLELAHGGAREIEAAKDVRSALLKQLALSR